MLRILDLPFSTKVRVRVQELWESRGDRPGLVPKIINTIFVFLIFAKPYGLCEAHFVRCEPVWPSGKALGW